MVAADLEWLPGARTEGAGEGPLEALPPWFVVMLVTALAAIAAFGTIGLALAVLGAMAPVPTLGLGAVTTIALVIALSPWRVAASRDRDAQMPALLAVALVAGAVVFAIIHHAQHVLLDRDPGGYVVTGRWLATHHTLAVNARVGAFKHAPKVGFPTPGVFLSGRNTLSFQFSHLLPTYLAQARWLGGDRAMFLVPPVLGGLGLLAFYALATRFVRPWIALAALAALATNLVETHFMRDAYSELPTQVVLLGALWLLTRRGHVAPVAAAFTGLLLGATVMARIDGPLYLIVVPLVLGGAALARRRGDADAPAAFGAVGFDVAVWFAGGVACSTALGYLDVRLRSPEYLHALAGKVNLQYAALALACVVAVGIGTFAPKLATWPARAARGRLGDIAALAVGGGLFAAWFLRPYVQTTHGRKHGETLAFQIFDHVRHDASRHYSEQSLHWQAWYLGALTLAAGIVGVALLTRAIVRGRGGREGLVVATFIVVAAVYLWNPSILPDQIWVMRRYLPVVIPGFVLGAFVVVELLWRRGRAASGAAWLRAAAVVLVIASIAWPASTAWKVRGDTTEKGFLGAVHRVCGLVGPNAAVVVLKGRNLEGVAPQTIRSFCNVPAAVSKTFGLTGPMQMKHDDFVALAADWKRAGRTLFVVGDSVDTIHAVLPEAQPIGAVDAVNTLFLQERIVARPDGFRREVYEFVVAPVPTG